MLKGYIFDIKRFALHDGPGIRVTFFLAGCPLRCWWCHNPEGMRELPAEGKADGAIRAISVDDLLAEFEKDVLYCDESGGGATFSGGEPLMQPEFLQAALRACRAREIHTSLDTTGYAPADVFASVIDDVDLFLYDLKLLDDAAHQQFTGVSNAPVLANLKTLAERGRRTVIRFPVIPGVTDTEDNLRWLAQFLDGLPTLREIHLLPYHQTASGKYDRLDLENKMSGVEPPSREKLEVIKGALERQGFTIGIGG